MTMHHGNFLHGRERIMPLLVQCIGDENQSDHESIYPCLQYDSQQQNFGDNRDGIFQNGMRGESLYLLFIEEHIDEGVWEKDAEKNVQDGQNDTE